MNQYSIHYKGNEYNNNYKNKKDESDNIYFFCNNINIHKLLRSITLLLICASDLN